MKLYTAIIFTDQIEIGNKGYIKWHNINNINRLIVNAKKLYPSSKFITIYDKKTKEKIDLIKL